MRGRILLFSQSLRDLYDRPFSGCVGFNVTRDGLPPSIMEVTLAFGAVGDIIAVTKLIKTIIVALDDCRGSAKEYQDALQNLEMLGKALQQVAEFYQDQRFNNHLGDLRAIALCRLQQIRLCLDGFSDKIQKLRQFSQTEEPRTKIQWKLEEKDVEKFRTEVNEHTMSLNMLLGITSVRVIQRNHEDSAQQASEAEARTAVMVRDSNLSLRGYFGVIGRRILSRLDYVSRLSRELKISTSHLISIMRAVSGELSNIRTAIMRLERPLNDEHFVFEDATGKVFPIHLRTITSWEAFEYVIADRFKGKKGAHRAQRKRYSLQERASRREVDRSTSWETAFLPYQRVDMSLMCREVQNSARVKSSLSCPRCLMGSPDETGVEVQCQICNMFFTRVIEVDKEASVGSTIGTATESGGKVQGSRKRKPTTEESGSDSDDEDVSGFSRITLISKRRRCDKSSLPSIRDQLESFRAFRAFAQAVPGNTDFMSAAAPAFDTMPISSASQGTKFRIENITVLTRSELADSSFQTSRKTSQDKIEHEAKWHGSSRDEVRKFAKFFANISERSKSDAIKANITHDSGVVPRNPQTTQPPSPHTSNIRPSASSDVNTADTDMSRIEGSGEDEFINRYGRTNVVSGFSQTKYHNGLNGIDSPQVQPHRVRFSTPSPPPGLGSGSKSLPRYRIFEPLQGDAVLVAHLGNGRLPDVAHTAALEPLDSDGSEDDSSSTISSSTAALAM
ncbi:hypothetical protein CI238_01433 [Colletotrichum incanum]|uniref:Ubiquitin-like domain-containing protein n=1 Tax=Colletotrichum incanum TaxID=1573173 RepID=A0A162PT08_COLIC|nr:hypothetical protein CI238_01433 [Colletotrichum incanum]